MGKRNSEDELESSGSDLEQMIAMLEKAEIDYNVRYADDGEASVDINDITTMVFNSDGDLQSVEEVD